MRFVLMLSAEGPGQKEWTVPVDAEVGEDLPMGLEGMGEV
jgi:hypothetical protein